MANTAAATVSSTGIAIATAIFNAVAQPAANISNSSFSIAVLTVDAGVVAIAANPVNVYSNIVIVATTFSIAGFTAKLSYRAASACWHDGNLPAGRHPVHVC